MSEYTIKRTKHFIRKEFGNSFVEKGTLEKVDWLAQSFDNHRRSFLLLDSPVRSQKKVKDLFLD